MSIINVSMADLKVAETPDILQTTLGSCIGIAIYDRENNIGGLAHIMLPVNNNGDTNKAKYADSAIPELIRLFTKIGIDRSSLVSKIAGGAKMFEITKKISNVSGSSYMLEIGLRNEEAVREGLRKEGIRLIAAETGKNYGRNIQFEIATGRMTIKSYGREAIVI